MAFNVAFKYHKKISTNNNEYPSPVQFDKYAHDRKLLNEDLLFATVDHTQKIMDTDFLEDCVTGYRSLDY